MTMSECAGSENCDKTATFYVNEQWYCGDHNPWHNGGPDDPCVYCRSKDTTMSTSLKVREIIDAAAERLEQRVEYGHQTVDMGWVVEPRGIKYATHQRTVHSRVDEPVRIDHWSDPDDRKPFERSIDPVLPSNDNSPSDASTDDYEESQSNTTRQSAGDGFRNNKLAGRSNDEPTPPKRQTPEQILARLKQLEAEPGASQPWIGAQDAGNDEPTDDRLSTDAGILKSLREIAATGERNGMTWTPKTIRAAMARLEAVTTERDRLNSGQCVDELIERIKRAEAELARVTTELATARGLLEAHCIHGYENDQHYPHDGPHELPTWREVVQLRSQKTRAETESQRMAMIFSRIDEYVDFNIHNKMHKVLLKAILEGKKVM